MKFVCFWKPSQRTPSNGWNRNECKFSNYFYPESLAFELRFSH